MWLSKNQIARALASMSIRYRSMVFAFWVKHIQLPYTCCVSLVPEVSCPNFIGSLDSASLPSRQWHLDKFAKIIMILQKTKRYWGDSIHTLTMITPRDLCWDLYMSFLHQFHSLIESDKTTSISNVSTRVLSKKLKHLLREENKVKENKIS